MDQSREQKHEELWESILMSKLLDLKNSDSPKVLKPQLGFRQRRRSVKQCWRIEDPRSLRLCHCYLLTGSNSCSQAKKMESEQRLAISMNPTRRPTPADLSERLILQQGFRKAAAGAAVAPPPNPTLVNPLSIPACACIWEGFWRKTDTR